MNERFPWDDDYEDTLSIGRWEGRCRSAGEGQAMAAEAIAKEQAA